MHRMIAGCNLWALLFLSLALVLGATRSPWHVPAGIFAAIFALLAQCAIFALFLGASRLLKEHVLAFGLDRSFIDRANRIMFPLFGWAFGASTLLLLFAIFAGLGSSGDLPVLVHAVLGAVTIVVLAVAVWREVPGLRRMHELLGDMERALPEPKAPAGATAAAAPDLRARGLFYVGSTVLAMLLGYRYISGIALPLPLVLLAGGGALGCLAGAAGLAWRGAGQPARREASQSGSTTPS